MTTIHDNLIGNEASSKQEKFYPSYPIRTVSCSNFFLN